MSGRADRTPVYERVFRRPRARGHDWECSFPRLYVADPRPPAEHLKEQARGGEPGWAGV